MAKTKTPAQPETTGPPPERVPLKHGMVALMYEEVQPGTVDPPKPPPLEKPRYRP